GALAASVGRAGHASPVATGAGAERHRTCGIVQRGTSEVGSLLAEIERRRKICSVPGGRSPSLLEACEPWRGEAPRRQSMADQLWPGVRSAFGTAWRL